MPDAAPALFLIDAMNVIGSRPKTRWWRDRAGAMRRLLVDLEPWARAAEAAGASVRVVFDGHPIAGVDGSPVAFEFAERPGPDGADDRIVELVTDAAAPGALVVVSSDRALRQRVQALGAQVLGAGSFLARVADAGGTTAP